MSTGKSPVNLSLPQDVIEFIEKDGPRKKGEVVERAVRHYRQLLNLKIPKGIIVRYQEEYESKRWFGALPPEYSERLSDDPPEFFAYKIASEGEAYAQEWARMQEIMESLDLIEILEVEDPWNLLRHFQGHEEGYEIHWFVAGWRWRKEPAIQYGQGAKRLFKNKK